MLRKVLVIVVGGMVLALVRILTDQPAFTGFDMHSLKQFVNLVAVMGYGAVIICAVDKK